MNRLPLGLVVAMSRNRVIGRDGKLPWHIPEDLKHFKAVTMGHAIIMGRKTYESIGRPLPGRRNLVVSARPGLSIFGCEVFASLEDALTRARETDAQPMIVGGATLYGQALPLVTTMHLTRVDRDVEGDTFFPQLSMDEWREVTSTPGPEGVTFLTLERRDA